MKKYLKAVSPPFVVEHSSCSNLTPLNFNWSLFHGDKEVRIDYGMKRGMPDAGFEKHNRFGWLCESRFIVPDIYNWLYNNHQILFDRFYNKIFTCEQSLLDINSNFVQIPSGSNYPWVRRKSWDIYPKNKLCSMFCSHKILTDEQRYRHKIADLALKRGFDVRGGYLGNPMSHSNLWDTKIEGIKDYMFHIVIENGVSENYYTEKLTDCIACGTIPVYRGAQNIHKFFDKEGIIVLEPGKEDEILSHLTPELYESKLKFIKNNFNILKELKTSDDIIYDYISNL